MIIIMVRPYSVMISESDDCQYDFTILPRQPLREGSRYAHALCQLGERELFLLAGALSALPPDFSRD